MRVLPKKKVVSCLEVGEVTVGGGTLERVAPRESILHVSLASIHGTARMASAGWAPEGALRGGRASVLHDIEDVHTHLPGTLEIIREWYAVALLSIP